MKKEIGYCLFCKSLEKTHKFKFNILDLDVPSSTLNCVYPHPTFYICEDCMENLPIEVNKLQSKKNNELIGNEKLSKLVPKIKELGIQQSESDYAGDIYQQIANLASAKKHIDAMEALINIIVMTIDLANEESIVYYHYEYTIDLNKEFGYFVKTMSNFISYGHYSNIISYCMFAISSIGYDPFECLKNYIAKISKLKGEKR